MIKGKWIGYYKYNDKKFQYLVGFEQTNFEIEIQSVNRNRFEGIVQDDLSTGGMKDAGIIKGKIINNKMKFVKQMPVMYGIYSNGKGKYFPDKKHPKIYYQGMISDDKKTIKGNWGFRNSESFITRFLGTKSLGDGTFEMKLQELTKS